MAQAAMTCLARPLLKRALVWGALSFALNLVWEVAQLPLYTIARTLDAARLAYAVLHCTVGDAFIATGSFMLAGFVFRDPAWPSSRPWSGGAVATAIGVAYTAYSEWYNVYQAGSWAYSAQMPLVFGIGLAPLLQWLFIPGITLLILRAGLHHRAPLDLSSKE